ncbi:hypothetical protein B0H15DRAFT_609676 [Mycena belliarum]|uniref:F-box domain-containing protein n=1 Tax=Mycena belliarum TaxID=1033014 RepID=A0AAD6TUA6_9AGAR|nr:hypothetical protein B0H15DRAFT_609676 [Mycena belliae]
MKRPCHRLLASDQSAQLEASPTLITIPTDILYIIFQMLYDAPIPPEDRERFDYESCRGSRLIPLSETCRIMRAESLPWIFREVYNWRREDGDVWPNTLWGLFVTLHIRDRAIRHPGHIPLSVDAYRALPMMEALTRVTVRFDAPVPPELLASLSLVPHLALLEIHHARFDGAPPPLSLPFATLETLVISTLGFGGMVRKRNIDHSNERRNVHGLLAHVCDTLSTLQISGDLLPTDFIAFRWRRLRKFTVTEHTPTPYISTPELVSQMPALRELYVLFSADLGRDEDELYPPFRLGNLGGQPLSPLLTSITLSNLEPADPIFKQLPHTLETLHLVAMQDPYAPGPGSPQDPREAAFTLTTVLTVIDNISHLDLSELSLTLNVFATAGLIHRIATVFPRLRFLQLQHSIYCHGDEFCLDVRDNAIADALRRLRLLTDLRISLDFEDRLIQEGPQASAARWLIQQLPGLRTVAFSWCQSWYFYGFESVVWRTWDRSVLLRPVPVPPPPRSLSEQSWDEEEGIAIPY